MRLEDFDYDLPSDRIAQEPLSRRDASRLMVLDRSADSQRGVGARASGPHEQIGLDHRSFTDLETLLSPGDLLVLNETRVLRARLWGRRADEGTSARVEMLLVERLTGVEEPGSAAQVWRVMLRGSRRPGETIDFGPGFRAQVLAREEGAFQRVALTPPAGLTVEEAVERRGMMPVPPYIHRGAPDDADPGARARESAIDDERYQTVFASSPGAIAAPTAGLHFTPELLDRLATRGIGIERLTLHVGPGTFLPVREDIPEEHRLLPETFAIPERVPAAIARTRASGGRIIAVGTTVTRALESQAAADGSVTPGSGRCDLFIKPGYRFRVVDALITNFHLPRSTLLMLVSTFAGRERILAAYAEAVRAGYRFYSYGDAMLIR